MRVHPSSVQLARWRKQAGLSQGAAAAKVGATQASWSRWERGLQLPPLRFAVRIEAVTGIGAISWARGPVGRRTAA